jgi:hypothetical protein
LFSHESSIKWSLLTAEAKRHADALKKQGKVKERLKLLEEVKLAECALAISPSRIGTVPEPELRAHLKILMKVKSIEIPAAAFCKHWGRYVELLIVGKKYDDLCLALQLWPNGGARSASAVHNIDQPSLHQLVPLCTAEADQDILVQAMLNSFAGDAMTELITSGEPAEALELATKLLKFYMAAEATNADVFGELADWLITPYDQVLTIAHAIVALAYPLPGFLNSCSEDVMHVLGEMEDEDQHGTYMSIRLAMDGSASWEAMILAYKAHVSVVDSLSTGVCDALDILTKQSEVTATRREFFLGDQYKNILRSMALDWKPKLRDGAVRPLETVAISMCEDFTRDLAQLGDTLVLERVKFTLTMLDPDKGDSKVQDMLTTVDARLKRVGLDVSESSLIALVIR